MTVLNLNPSEAVRVREADAGCLCDMAVRGLGVLYGINMGKGLVRVSTHPECPVHALCRHYTKPVRALRSNGAWLWCNVHGKKDCPR